MLKKTITFKDLDDNTVTEDFYFNLSKAELSEMEFSRKNGLSGYLQDIIDSESKGELIAMFKEIIIKAIGRRGEDGKRFEKSQEITDSFVQSDAYSELFMELATNTGSAVAFINAVVPAGIAEDAQKILNAQKTETVELPEGGVVKDDRPEVPFRSRDYYLRKLESPSWEPNGDDLQHMDKDLIAQAYARKNATK